MKLLLGADLHGVPTDPALLGNLAQARGYGLVVLAGDLLDLFAGEPAVGQFGPDYLFCGHIHQAPFARGGSWAARVPGTDTWCFNPGCRQTGPCLVELDTAALPGTLVSLLALGGSDARPGRKLNALARTAARRERRNFRLGLCWLG